MVIPPTVLKQRKAIANDLHLFMEIVWKELPNCDLSGITAAITELNNSKYIPQINNKKSDPKRWGYDAPDLLFRFPADPEKSKPHPLKDVELSFSVAVRGNTDYLNTFNDPFESLNFDIIITGKHKEREMITSYHLDRHIFEDGDNPSKESHPCYHFQFGGKKMIDEHGKAVDCGSLMFLEPPRISYHPMDLILGIDFLLSNFFPHNWTNLTNNYDEYNNLVEKHQRLFLKPFALSFASYWDKRVLNGDEINWSALTIHPQLK
ncbi:hypothetical protein [Aequorivita marisscotiae]|uniref:Uncharacterized protein n=1 Tax=Aequorivita marisscotiae TaxID=3040348 RepID=A0ABY8KUV2_9FLAO|nr:hypothetical protein [Aequorivita sp. Ant34-E75]WGF91536.1 hypothetical protein QCQ61_09985 [Aequorivita sp. Ant34-E75]